MDAVPPADEELAGVKAGLRSRCRRVRRALSPAERAEASRRITGHLLGLPEVRRADAVALYAAFADEVDLTSLLEPLAARGTRVALPRVAGPHLELVAVTHWEGLVTGHRGVREPDGEPIDTDAVDVVVVPGLAFDRQGGRLGQGGGHYDRLLARLPTGVTRVGVCFAGQLVARVPTATHDEPVDVVVTEEGTVRVRAPR